MSGSPLAVAISPDGARVYAARKGAIEVVDMASMARVGERKLAGTPIELVVTDTRAVEVQAGGAVAILDLTTGRLVRRIKLAGAAGVALDSKGHAWVSATTPRKGKRKAFSRIVRIDPVSGGISGSVALGTDGGGGLGISPDATKAIVAPGAKVKGIGHRKAALVDLVARARARPPAHRRRARPRDLLARRPRLYVTDSTRKTLSSCPPRPPTGCARCRSQGTPGGSWSSPAWR